MGACPTSHDIGLLLEFPRSYWRWVAVAGVAETEVMPELFDVIELPLC